jgi:hypothetical protein
MRADIILCVPSKKSSGGTSEAGLTIFPKRLLVGDGKPRRDEASVTGPAVPREVPVSEMDDCSSKYVFVDLTPDLGGQFLEKQRLALIMSGC